MRATTSDSTTTEPDPRFTFGLLYDTAKGREAHGYGPFDGRQRVELGQHLIHFLCSRGDRCYGGQTATVDPPTGVDEHRAEVARKAAALRKSGAADEAALVRSDERWGVRR
ncbi:MAG: hypothetical protein ACRD2C_12050 [Acidimicrobiales bacterium]